MEITGRFALSRQGLWCIRFRVLFCFSGLVFANGWLIWFVSERPAILRNPDLRFHLMVMGLFTVFILALCIRLLILVSSSSHEITLTRTTVSVPLLKPIPFDHIKRAGVVPVPVLGSVWFVVFRRQRGLFRYFRQTTQVLISNYESSEELETLLNRISSKIEVP